MKNTIKDIKGFFHRRGLMIGDKTARKLKNQNIADNISLIPELTAEMTEHRNAKIVKEEDISKSLQTIGIFEKEIQRQEKKKLQKARGKIKGNLKLNRFHKRK